MACDEFDPLEDGGFTASTHVIEPKLDGVRCVAVVSIEDMQAVSCRLYARSGLRIWSCIHIEQAVVQMCNCNGRNWMLKTMVLDGELWCPSLAFDQISGLVRRKNEQAHAVQFHIFDTVWFSSESEWLNFIPLKVRYMTLQQFQNSPEAAEWRKHIQFVNRLNTQATLENGTHCVESYLDYACDCGYEGIVIKELQSKYKFGRSNSWLKYKPLLSSEFVVVAVVEGTGAMKGKVGALTLRSLPSQYPILDVLHTVGTGLNNEQRTAWWSEPSQIIHATIEVTFQSVTSEGNLRFPSFHRIIVPPPHHT